MRLAVELVVPDSPGPTNHQCSVFCRFLRPIPVADRSTWYCVLLDRCLADGPVGLPSRDGACLAAEAADSLEPSS